MKYTVAIAALLNNSARSAVFSTDMSTMSCFGATTDTTSDPRVYNGQYCLAPGSFYEGQCCDFSAAAPADDAPANCKIAPAYTAPVAAVDADGNALNNADGVPTFTTGLTK